MSFNERKSNYRSFDSNKVNQEIKVLDHKKREYRPNTQDILKDMLVKKGKKQD